MMETTVDEHAKENFGRLADCIERFQKILAAAGNAPKVERMLLGMLVKIIALDEPGIEEMTGHEIGETLDDYFGKEGGADGEA